MGPALTALFVGERDFLPGEDAPWIEQTRGQLGYSVAGPGVLRGGQLGIGGTELAAAVRVSRQLTRLAPLRESGYRYLMGALAAQDNLAEALDAYAS